jgi:putative DNA primase/helicase
MAATKMADFTTARHSSSLPKINTGIGDLRRITDLAWNAILQSNKPPYLFRHGGSMCRLESNDLEIPIIRVLSPTRLRHELARVAHWVATVEGKEIESKPPRDVVQDVLATPNPPLPVLKRVTRVPVFAFDGSLQTTPGYHERSQTYYAPLANFELMDVSDSPIQDEIQCARPIILDELFANFCFVSEADRAHAVGLFLLPHARDLIDGPTPNHLVSSPQPGSAKGLLTDVALRAAIPNPGSVPQARDDDEWRKRLTSYFREGREVMSIDNVNKPLDSGALASALTQTTWEDRILGKNETVSLPIRCVWTTTANNPTMSTEIARRTVRIHLDTGLELPWLRTGFRHENLRQWVDENRAFLVWAAHTLIKAWIAAGRPKPMCKSLGSYEAWSSVIGGSLENAHIQGFSVASECCEYW